jgi:uncharacterized membrane protein YqjE
MNTSTAESPPAGLGRLHASAAVFARGVDHRAELAAIELVEARNQAAGLSGLYLIGGVVALLTGVAINFLVAAIWWDTPHRILAVGLFTGLQATVATIAIVAATRRMREWAPLSQSFQQLKKDAQCLRELLTSPRN